ncbi:unnamed protein product [Rhizophagus irregularis]|nr:unnamed protein product [Rhizophagus irregularis]
MDKVQLKFDQTVKIDREFYGSLCVSDDKKLAYTDDFVNIVEMNNKDKKIALSFDKKDKNKIETRKIGIFNIQLYNFMNHTGLFLLPSLFCYTPDKEIKYCWNSKYKNWSNRLNALFDEDDQIDGILNERVWKSKFYENMSKTKVIECDDDDKKTYNHLNVHSFNPCMDTVSTLFQNATCDN